MAPTIISGDSAGLCIIAQNLKLHFGSPVDHPLHAIIGKCFSFLPFELAYSMNLMSAFFGVLTVFFVFLIIKKYTQSNFASFFGSLSLMVSHAFWQHSVIAEVYTLNTFFIVGLIYYVQTNIYSQNFKYFFPIIFIIGLTNHLILILLLPSFLFFIWAKADLKRRQTAIKIIGVLFVIFILIVSWFLIYRHSFSKQVINAILIGPPSIIHYIVPPKNLSIFIKEIVYYFYYLCYQYPFGGMLIGIVGIIRFLIKDRISAIFLLLMILINAFFFIKTTQWGSYGGTKYTFYISDYTIFSVFVGYGALEIFNYAILIIERSKILTIRFEINRLLKMTVVTAYVLFAVLFYLLIPKIVTYLNVDLLHARSLPYRDNNKFFLNPNKFNYQGDRQLGQEILKSIEQNSFVIADFTIYEILRYLKEIENMRPDVNLIKSRNISIKKYIDKIKKIDPNAHIYIADDNEQNTGDYYNLNGLGEEYILLKSGSFFEIILK